VRSLSVPLRRGGEGREAAAQEQARLNVDEQKDNGRAADLARNREPALRDPALDGGGDGEQARLNDDPDPADRRAVDEEAARRASAEVRLNLDDQRDRPNVDNPAARRAREEEAARNRDDPPAEEGGMFSGFTKYAPSVKTVKDTVKAGALLVALPVANYVYQNAGTILKAVIGRRRLPTQPDESPSTVPHHLIILASLLLAILLLLAIRRKVQPLMARYRRRRSQRRLTTLRQIPVKTQLPTVKRGSIRV